GAVRKQERPPKLPPERGPASASVGNSTTSASTRMLNHRPRRRIVMTRGSLANRRKSAPAVAALVKHGRGGGAWTAPRSTAAAAAAPAPTAESNRARGT